MLDAIIVMLGDSRPPVWARTVAWVCDLRRIHFASFTNKAFDDTDFTFEYVRCLLPSRFFQLVKELHVDTRRWSYIQPLYRQLLAKVYEDLHPDVPVVSSGELENLRCASGVASAVLGRAMRAKGQAKARRLRLMRFNLLKFEFVK